MSELDGAAFSRRGESARRGWTERPAPWWSEAFGASGAVIAGSGLALLGFDISQNAATALIGIYVAVAYLAEPFVPRTGQAACTTIVTLGTPAFVALLIFPVHTYNGFRLFEVATIVLWFAFFAIGGTRGRMVLLALAVTFVWVFVTLEVGHVQQTARYLTPFQVTPGIVTPPFVGGSSETCTSTPEGGEVCIGPNGSVITGGAGLTAPARPKTLHDYSLGIGLESLAFGALFLYALRDGARADRRGLATAFVIPAVLSLGVAVTALGNKVDHLWVTGLFALLAGLVAGIVDNGTRRFLTWFGAIASAVGVALIAGDIADSIWGNHSHVARWFGYTFFVFGLATMFAAVLAARVLGESDRSDAPMPTTL